MSHKCDVTGNIVVFVPGRLAQDIKDRSMGQEKRKLSFCMPLASANGKQLKNFSVVIPI